MFGNRYRTISRARQRVHRKSASRPAASPVGENRIVYEKNNVKVIHWQRSHAKDGASAYRLDWQITREESLCFVWTGDGRPSKLDIKYAAGCDVYVTTDQIWVREGILPDFPNQRAPLRAPFYLIDWM
jgi:hypothetical protein